MRLVLDTNVWLDWLVFDDPGIAPIKHIVASGTATIFMSLACATELKRVLGYVLSGRALDMQAQSAALALCKAMSIAVEECHETHAIETLPEFVVIDNLALSEGSPGNQELSLTLAVSTYYRAGSDVR